MNSQPWVAMFIHHFSPKKELREQHHIVQQWIEESVWWCCFQQLWQSRSTISIVEYMVQMHCCVSSSFQWQISYLKRRDDEGVHLTSGGFWFLAQILYQKLSIFYICRNPLLWTLTRVQLSNCSLNEQVFNYAFHCRFFWYIQSWVHCLTLSSNFLTVGRSLLVLSVSFHGFIIFA